MNTDIKTVDEYIAQYPEEVQSLLAEVRAIIIASAPKAVEGISYGMPGYKYLGKPLVYFGGYKGHIGFYATPNGHEAFAKEFAKYKQGKGSVQFPLDEKLPLALIKKVVKFRMNYLNEIAKTKK